jgi:hypothetical protein
MLDGGNVMRAWFAKDDEWPQMLIPECILWPQPCNRPRWCPVDCTFGTNRRPIFPTCSRTLRLASASAAEWRAFVGRHVPSALWC